MKYRIWELDAFRGICILGMVFVHFVYDLVALYRIINWAYPVWFSLMINWGGVLFVLLSGICATLGRRSVRRGCIVFGCGMLVTAVTFGMYLRGFDKSILIYFGVLHCLGACMILWWLFGRLPTWLLAVLGAAFIVAGLYLQNAVLVDHLWLIPLGFISSHFSSADYFPLLPNLGYFLLGAVMGRTLYRKKTTIFPAANPNHPLIRALRFLGRHSLGIYLLHQPILSGACMLLMGWK